MNDSPPPLRSGGPPAKPRWVKGLGVLLVVAVLLVALVLLQGGDQHGPGLHTGMSDPAEHPAGSLVSDASGRPPAAA